MPHRRLNLSELCPSEPHIQNETVLLVPVQAVDQTHSFESGNVHLTKAIRLNSAARLWVIYILALFTFAILFLDWWYS